MEFKFLHEYFLQKAEVFPDKTAITSFSYSLTFKQLSELSDEYSLFLQEKGLKPGQLVLMKIHTSPPAIALMLGVSKAGSG
jgi:acyl-coenzyme A synthetase/AMP-(fatty) acid ligase